MDGRLSTCDNINILIKNKKDYSDRYGWDFICRMDNHFDKSLPAAYSKIKFILEEFNNYNLIFWIDMDCVFTNYTIDISNSLGEKFMGVLNQGPRTGYEKYFCTGNILVKNNEYTEGFFKSLYDLESWGNPAHPWEQKCFNELLIKSSYAHIKDFNIGEFGAFNKEGWWCIRPWKIGDFILHISSGGIKNISWQDRINLFISTYKDLIIT